MLNKTEKLIITEDRIESKFPDTISFNRAIPIRFDNIRKQAEILNNKYLYPMVFTQNNLIELLYNLESHGLILDNIDVGDEELSESIITAIKNGCRNMLNEYLEEMKENDMEIRFISLYRDNVNYGLYKKGVITIEYDDDRNKKMEVLNKEFLFEALGV